MKIVDGINMNRRVGLIYLAGAVDAAGEAARDWRVELSDVLTQMGFTTYSPPHAFRMGELVSDVALAVQKVNTAALRASAAVIANAKGQSWGTSLECQEATKLETPIPVFVFGGSMHSVYQWDYHCWVPLFEEVLPFVDAWLDNRG